ncbi:hypothetical protein IBE59_08975 [Francisella philomiragia]|uniref:hypothetical protein n=1 Tax=Francisella philomiragia TaxID=28110 RepID=UPI0019058A55|nr:hypothetical protein [Francisella philomiragia]MBK2277735.1 hypothetical protein [Francisella philomiragia]
MEKFKHQETEKKADTPLKVWRSPCLSILLSQHPIEAGKAIDAPSETLAGNQGLPS